MVTDSPGTATFERSRAKAGKIEIEGLTKVYSESTDQDLHALGPLNLIVESGSFVSILGPSGCGKSTLLRLVAGLEQPTEGSISLDEVPVFEPGHERGLVFQDPTLFPWLTVRKNVESSLRARGALKQQGGEVTDYLRLVGLEEFENAYPHQLSGGMAQRAALARALIHHPKALLLDEPLGALDAFTRMLMQDELLRIWANRGTTTLLVTHDIDEAIYMSDRILILSPSPGRIQVDLPVEIGRPRARNHPDFLALRAEILKILHFSRDEVWIPSI